MKIVEKIFVAMVVAVAVVASGETPLPPVKSGGTPLPPAQKKAFEFRHPGYAVSRADLDWVKAHLGVPPFNGCFEALKRETPLDWEMRGTFEETGRSPDVNLWQWRDDMSKAYDFARMWYFTDDERYAAKAREILLAWAKVHKRWSGAESFMSIGDYTYRFIGAAEILRGTWKGWSEEDTELFKQYLLGTYWWTCPVPRPLHSAVQGMLQLGAGVGIAVFCDDREKFAECLRAFRDDAIGGLSDSLPDGQAGDSGRDQGHVYGQLIQWAMTAETFWLQGVDVYSLFDYRLHAIGEYYARYNFGAATPFMRFGSEYDIFAHHGGEPESSPKQPDFLNIIHKAYARLGIPTPYVDAYRALRTETADSMMFRRDDDKSKAKRMKELAPVPAAAPVRALMKADVKGFFAPEPEASITEAKGVWTIRGKGTKDVVSGPHDAYTLFYLPLEGDGEIVARLDALSSPVSEKAMAGIMVTDKLEADTRKLVLRMGLNVTNDRAPGAGTRALLNMRGDSASCSGRREQQHSLWDTSIMYLPCWLRLVRRGDRVTAYHSPDGGSWSPMQTVDFDGLAKTCYAGLFVANGEKITAEFSNVAITQKSGETPLPPALPPGFALVSPSDGANIVRWLDGHGAAKYRVLRCEAKEKKWQKIAETAANIFIDRDVVKGAKYGYKVQSVAASGRAGGATKPVGAVARNPRKNYGRDKTTYANPIIPGDYSDPDVIRVGKDYYMVTSSFQMSPGVPVLHSRDLVNWKTIGAAIPDLTMVSDDFRPERMNEYNRGIYAPSIRYHNKKFYVYVPSLDDGIIVSVADRPEGPWKADWLRKADGTPWKARRRTDPCPYWDGKGNGWLALSWLDDGWNGWLYKLSDDGLRLLDDGWRFSPYRSTEGHKIYFRNGYYYLVHIEFLNEGNGQGTYIMRSRDINGPYEMLKVNLDIPGQGCLVDLPDGRWVWIAQFNTPGEPNGRKPEMLPVEWIDDWPVIGVEPKDLHGKFAKRLPFPLPLAKDAEAQGSDNFDSPTLDPMWQWNHVPEDGAWSLAERKGWMRIRGRAGRPFFKTPNVLCQRVLQREDGASVSVKVDGARLRDGEAAGLALFNGGKNYAIDGIVREDGKLKRFFEKDGERTILGEIKGTVATFGFEVKGAVCTSATGKIAEIRGANYRGINAGLYSTGLADFDDFEMEYTR